MKTSLLSTIALALPLGVGAAEPAAAQKELDALKGRWKAVSMEAGGRALPTESLPEFVFTVGANGRATGKSSQEEYQARVSVDGSKEPKTIDNLHETGSQQGRKQYGIYRLEGDKWTVCMTRPGVSETDRPKSFETKDTFNVVFVFKRTPEIPTK